MNTNSQTLSIPTETTIERESETEIETDSNEATASEPESTADRDATVAELTIPVEDFALGETIAALDGVDVEVERVVETDGPLTPLVWVTDVGRVPLERALNDDPSVVDFDLFAAIGDGDETEYLYRMTWGPRTRRVVDLLVDEGATVLAATAVDDRWHLRLLLPAREALARAHEVCREAGLFVDVTKIYAPNEGRQAKFGLTDRQREALTVAFERGYYEVPRGTMAKECAEELDISHQALSERLRRAHGNLVENAVVLEGRDRSR